MLSYGSLPVVSSRIARFVHLGKPDTLYRTWHMAHSFGLIMVLPYHTAPAM